jgi:hypothetical protein
VQRLKTYKAKLVVFPRRARKFKVSLKLLKYIVDYGYFLVA